MKVEKCQFLVDFVKVIMKISGNLSHASNIFGRPFFSMNKAIIDWDKRTVELKVGLEKIEVPISHLMKDSKDSNEDIFFLNIVEEDDFGCDLYQHELFSLDDEEIEEDLKYYQIFFPFLLLN